MKILYLSSVCSQSRFDSYAAKKMIKKLPQAQKYHSLLAEGLAHNANCQVQVISSYPVVGRKGRYFKEENETANGVNYCYLSFWQLPFIRQLCLWVNAYRALGKYGAKDSDTYLVCDVLNRSVAGAARFYGKLHNKKVCGIVTDVPGHTSDARMKTYTSFQRWFKQFCRAISKDSEKKFDTYLLLTEQMNDVVNPNNKPYIVLEGQCDIRMQMAENLLSEKSNPNMMMYAGGIHREFGIERFVKAFLQVNDPNWTFHIYGDGNYSKELEKIAFAHPNLVFHGVVPNGIVTQAQLQARLLVNPRITDAEYVKYSFPSKTMECMVSGTPLLTTRLPGMPKAYYPYVYFIDDESVEGMCSALKSVMCHTPQELHEMGNRAKGFMLQHKNNVSQAKKMIDFLRRNA